MAQFIDEGPPSIEPACMPASVRGGKSRYILYFIKREELLSESVSLSVSIIMRKSKYGRWYLLILRSLISAHFFALNLAGHFHLSQCGGSWITMRKIQMLRVIIDNCIRQSSHLPLPSCVSVSLSLSPFISLSLSLFLFPKHPIYCCHPPPCTGGHSLPLVVANWKWQNCSVMEWSESRWENVEQSGQLLESNSHLVGGPGSRTLPYLTYI